MVYTTEWPIRLRDVDTHENIFYPAVFLEMQQIIEVIFDEAGYAFHSELPAAGLNVPIVHAEADYLAPIHLGETVTVETEASFGTSSITFDSTGFIDADPVFRAQQVNAIVNDDFESQRLPDDLRDAISDLTT